MTTFEEIAAFWVCRMQFSSCNLRCIPHVLGETLGLIASVLDNSLFCLCIFLFVYFSRIIGQNKNVR